MTAHTRGDKPDSPPERPRTAGAEDGAETERGMNPLQHLIQQRLRDRGWSYGEVARRGELPR